MTIPFRSLRFSGDDRQEWGIALSRHVPRMNEDAYWPLVSKRVQGVVPQFATAVGLERISPGANLQVAPTARSPARATAAPARRWTSRAASASTPRSAWTARSCSTAPSTPTSAKSSPTRRRSR
ncbi:MAG: hypothetical protein R2708_17010 [Vicinamibacterales bacterium]